MYIYIYIYILHTLLSLASPRYSAHPSSTLELGRRIGEGIFPNSIGRRLGEGSFPNSTQLYLSTAPPPASP